MENLELPIFIVSALGAVLGAGVTNVLTFRMASAERKEARRKARVDFLLNTLDQLITSYEGLRTNDTYASVGSRARIISLSLSINDLGIYNLIDEMQSSKDYEVYVKNTEKIITRLGEIIKETSNID